jgi:hypothetical protein
MVLGFVGGGKNNIDAYLPEYYEMLAAEISRKECGRVWLL